MSQTRRHAPFDYLASEGDFSRLNTHRIEFRDTLGSALEGVDEVRLAAFAATLDEFELPKHGATAQMLLAVIEDAVRGVVRGEPCADLVTALARVLETSGADARRRLIRVRKQYLIRSHGGSYGRSGPFLKAVLDAIEQADWMNAGNEGGRHNEENL